ncbi:bifunctional MaoC family dehydratase N-terminal/OB-fold nucleic acid binding domain-containing protein [Embleya sp. NPDC008237]|uniref:bifunctional MaoC family dehydratase N-terminal/OB-fold nucleic acid binding domain-containing protein n=1 Tax=Embleya sp. NPDC008237 TaxID=3363978 RepID=UPI0036E40B78
MTDPISQDKAAFLAVVKKYEGRHDVSGVLALDPVNGPMIRHWAEAMGDTNPVYTDPEAAARTHFGEVVAPAAMLQVWIMRGMQGGAPANSATGELYKHFTDNGFGSVVATNCEQEYMRPLRLGELVQYDQLIETVSEEKTTGLGTGHFITTLTNIYVTGESGRELVGTHRFRILRYTPHKKKAEAAPPAERPLRPRKVVNKDNQAFWDGVAAGKLLFQKCLDCATPRFPFAPGCNKCASLEWETVESTGKGVVYSHVTMHYPKFPAFDMPYAVGLIELEEGVRMLGNVLGVPHDEVRIGMPVELEFVTHDAELTVPAFRAVGEN